MRAHPHPTGPDYLDLSLRFSCEGARIEPTKNQVEELPLPGDVSAICRGAFRKMSSNPLKKVYLVRTSETALTHALVYHRHPPMSNGYTTECVGLKVCA